MVRPSPAAALNALFDQHVVHGAIGLAGLTRDRADAGSLAIKLATELAVCFRAEDFFVMVSSP